MNFEAAFTRSQYPPQQSKALPKEEQGKLRCGCNIL